VDGAEFSEAVKAMEAEGTVRIVGDYSPAWRSRIEEIVNYIFIRHI
jgi:hypothetical protein